VSAFTCLYDLEYMFKVTRATLFLLMDSSLILRKSLQYKKNQSGLHRSFNFINDRANLHGPNDNCYY